jgi:hypothetical protein
MHLDRAGRRDPPVIAADRAREPLVAAFANVARASGEQATAEAIVWALDATVAEAEGT